MTNKIAPKRLINLTRDFSYSCQLRLQSDSVFASTFEAAVSDDEYGAIMEISLDVSLDHALALFGEKDAYADYEKKIMQLGELYAGILKRSFTQQQIDQILPLNFKSEAVSKAYASEGKPHLARLAQP